MSKYAIPRLETERLILRAVQIEDAQDMFEYASQDNVVDFVTFPKHESIHDSTEAIKNFFLNRPSKKWPEAFAIVLKENNKMIGTCDFWPVSGSKCFEMGYVLNPEYWNQGIMSEAAQCVLNFAFHDYGVRRMELNHIDGNIGSKKVALRLGFVFEGTKRKAVEFKSEYQDLLFYGLLEEEFQ